MERFLHALIGDLSTLPDTAVKTCTLFITAALLFRFTARRTHAEFAPFDWIAAVAAGGDRRACRDRLRHVVDGGHYRTCLPPPRARTHHSAEIHPSAASAHRPATSSARPRRQGNRRKSPSMRTHLD